MKLRSSNFAAFFFLLSFYFPAACLGQILFQNFDGLNSLEEFQDPNPDVGQVNKINLNLPEEENPIPIFSLGEEGEDKFLLIQKQGRKFRHFIRYSGFEDLPSLVIRFKFSVQEASETNAFAGLFIGKELGETSFYPDRPQRWAKLVIEVDVEGNFTIENHLPEDDGEEETEDGAGEEEEGEVEDEGESTQRERIFFSGEQMITIVANNSGASLKYEDAEGEEISLEDRRIDVWIGKEQVIKNEQVYLGAASNISSVKFLTWGNNLNATARLDKLLIEEYNRKPLPVKLLDFKGWLADRDVELSWQTLSEVNSSYFVVERSQDGLVFDSLARVKAAGNSKSKKEYDFVDSGVADFLAGEVYYRLRQVDVDGKWEFSPLVMVELPEEKLRVLGVYPNPFSDYLDVNLQQVKSQKMEVSLYNLLGTPIVEKQQVSFSPGNLRHFRISQLEYLPSGMYLLEVMTNSQRKRFHLIKL